MLDAVCRRLLDERDRESGVWRGRLSSSAVATAIAISALHRARAAGSGELVRGGSAWLAAHQNADGGWGDSPGSPSNATATLLGWAALGAAADLAPGGQAAADRARAWVRRRLGDAEPATLAGAVLREYGGDRTFSAPILCMLALCGRLGGPGECWGLVPQLPFELAACPRQLFRWLRLPVVSYAIPALIAVGLARHRSARRRGPAAALRDAVTSRVLRVLERIQPASGGFLEAAPLTGFVVMCLAASGYGDHAVVERGARFLSAGVRDDGSWPIDTDLAVWVTAQAASALAGQEGCLDPETRQSLVQWLLARQTRDVHPFTGSPAGGWGWTDRPGGVPDADDTSAALVALRRLCLPQGGLGKTGASKVRDAARLGVRWLLGIQNRDGGFPTFCRGWGRLPFDRSCPDITAHALEAMNEWRDELPPDLGARVDRGVARGLGYLARAQRPDGAWVPLWFGNQNEANRENPVFGTARVLAALAGLEALYGERARTLAGRGCAWLLNAQNGDGGWGGGPGLCSTIEETAAALNAVALAPGAEAAARRAAAWLDRETEGWRRFPAAPIGLYFARLWYSEDLYPLVFTLAGLGRLRRRRAG